MGVATRRSAAAREIAASALCLGYGVAVHRVVPHAAYVPSNVSAAALSLLLARRLGAGWDDLGVRTDRLATGLRTGLVSAASLAVAVGLGVAVPLTRRFFLDERVARSTHPVAAVLVRIPVGTAFGEEVMFRGALLGLFLGRHPPALAAALTSGVFGLWHLLPASDQLHAGALSTVVGDAPAARAAWMAATALFATAAGLLFASLRLRARSVAAPVVAHAGANVAAFVAARVASRLGR